MSAPQHEILPGDANGRDGTAEPPYLIAYHGARPYLDAPAPADRWREWMNLTNRRVANRCLPLLVANESGWTLRNPHTFTATWSGEDQPAAVELEYDARAPEVERVSLLFGSGTLSWNIPFLFRTPPGWNLLVRGPANMPRDGASPLEGLVETDWSVSTFTMNWKLTRAGLPVTFEAGEPICLLVPQRRGDLESFLPSMSHIAADPDTAQGLEAFHQRRHQTQVNKFLAEYSQDHADAIDAWERDYFKGRRPDGPPAPEHQTKLRLRPFEPGEQ